MLRMKLLKAELSSSVPNMFLEPVLCERRVVVVYYDRHFWCE